MIYCQYLNVYLFIIIAIVFSSSCVCVLCNVKCLLSAKEMRELRHHMSLKSNRGASSTVHKSKLGGRIVAMKIVDGDMFKLAEQELKALQSVQSAHIVNLIGASLAEGVIVTEWMSGGTLRALISKKHLYGTLAIYHKQLIALCVVSGVCDLHNNNIVHRDIKSENVLLSHDLHAKIADFGISRHGQSIKTSKPGGTAQYMAPESWDSDEDTNYVVSFAGDVYAVGILLLEIFSGSLPWGNLSEGQIAKLKSKDYTVPLDKLDEVKMNAPELRALIEKCVLRDPSKRPQMFEVRQDLQNW